MGCTRAFGVAGEAVTVAMVAASEVGGGAWHFYFRVFQKHGSCGWGDAEKQLVLLLSCGLICCSLLSLAEHEHPA